LTVGERIREAQRVARVSNEEVAEAADVHVKTVSQWRNDRQMPTDDNLRAIAPVLRTTFAYLKNGDGEQPTDNREPPAVALGLPRRVRERIQEFLLELIRADVSDREVEEARRVLTSPELYRLMKGGEPGEESEEQILVGLTGFSEAIKDTLRSRGYSIAK
jgi:transcriptional regulator with XRE-family HTH domain